MRSLRIGINALYLIPGGVGGTEIYLGNLLREWAESETGHHFFVFTNAETGATLAPKRPNFHTVPQAVRAAARPARILWEQIALPIAAREMDVLFNPGFTAPLLCSAPQVTVFHDLQHKRHPENFRWFDLPFWRLLLWLSAHRSRKLIAVSEATRGDLLRFYRLPADRVHVIHHGVEAAFFELNRSQIESYVLCVSTLHPHKNLERLIRAYARRKREYRLVLAGMRGFYTQALEKLIEQLGLTSSVTSSRCALASTNSPSFARIASASFTSSLSGLRAMLAKSVSLMKVRKETSKSW